MVAPLSSQCLNSDCSKLAGGKVGVDSRSMVLTMVDRERSCVLCSMIEDSEEVSMELSVSMALAKRSASMLPDRYV